MSETFTVPETGEVITLPPASGQVIEITPRGAPAEPVGLGSGTGEGVGAGAGEGAPTPSGPPSPPPRPMNPEDEPPGPEPIFAGPTYEDYRAEANAVAVVEQARERVQRRRRDSVRPVAAPMPEEPRDRQAEAQQYAQARAQQYGPVMSDAGPGTEVAPPEQPAGTPPAQEQRGQRAPRRVSETQSTARAVARSASEMVLGVERGVVGAFASAFEAADDLADWLNARVPLSGVAAGDPGTPGRTIGRAIRTLQLGREPETTAGRVTEEIAQFVTGFLRGSAVLRSRGVLQGSGRGAQAARGAAAGAIADAFFNEADESNFADLWKRLNLPGQSLTDFLATDPNDEAAVNRLRNAAAGVIVGAALDGLLAVARVTRAARAAREQSPNAPAAPADAAPLGGVAARPERDLLIVGDPSRPLVEVRPAGDAGARLVEAAAATSDAAMGVGPDVAARALVGAAEAQRRLAAYQPPSWIMGEPIGPAGREALDEAERLAFIRSRNEAADFTQNVMEMVHALRGQRIGPRGEVSLTSFLVKNGGVRNEGGELSYMGAIRQRPGLVNNRSGMTVDRAMEAAREAGYFDDLADSAGSNAQRLADVSRGEARDPLDRATFLDALRGDLDRSAPRFGRTLDEAGRQLEQAARDLDEVLSARGVSINSTDAEIRAALAQPAETVGRTLDDMAAEDAARASGASVTGAPLPAVENTAAIRAATDPGEVFINWGRIRTAEDVQAILRDLADAFRPRINEAGRGVQSNEETARLASMLNLSVPELLARRPGEVFNAETALAARQLYTASGERLMQAAQMAAAPAAGPLEQAAFRRMMATHYAIQAEVLGARREAGRALQAWAIPAEAGGRQMRMIEDLLEATGGVDVSRAMASRLAILGRQLPPDQLAPALSGFVNRGWGGRTIEAVQQWWINALLSNPATHMANIVGNGLNAPLLLLERTAQAGIGRMTGSADAAMMMEAPAMIYAMGGAFMDSLRLAVRTYGDDGAEVAAMIGRQDLPRQGAISSQAWNVDPGSGFGRALDFFGHQIVSAPGRAMGAEDAFFKSMIYRMELHAHALRQAMREAPRQADGTLDPAAVGRLMADIMRNPPEEVAVAAADAALYRTFNREAGPIAAKLLAARNSDSAGWNLMMATILPFVRTPANIFSYSLERTPLAPMVGQWRADIAAGGARRDAALARIAVGSMILSQTYQWAEGGLVNGAGPTDPDERAVWMAAGNQPYSARIGDAWVPFNRLDPYGFILGFAADLRELMDKHDLGEREEIEAKKIAAAVTTMIAAALVNRSFFSGVGSIAEALNPQQPSMDRYIDRTIGALVVPGIVNAAGQAMDPTNFDSGPGAVATRLEPMRAWLEDRLGVLQAEPLIPRRNLWGDPVMRPGAELLGATGAAISPVRLTPVGQRPIEREMARLNMGLLPVDRNGTVTLNGVPVNVRNINPQALDQLRRWAGNEPAPNEDGTVGLPAWGRVGFADALDQMVRGEGPYGAAFLRANDDRREGMIRETAEQFRRAARSALLRDPRFSDVAEIASARRGESGEVEAGRKMVPTSPQAAMREPGEAPPPRQRQRQQQQPAVR